MVADKVVANAVGAKTARACDGCIRKRARWYCAADDAFLCQACDASVHSANPLARRHERVRLKTASNNKSLFDEPSQVETPSWHRGFTRKARTPRHGKSGLNNPHHHHHQTPQLSSEEEEPIRNLFPLVPEISFDQTSPYENEEQLLYRVPIFDPFLAELCTSTTTTTSPNEAASAAAGGEATGVANEYDVTGMSESKVVIAGYGSHNEDNLNGFLPTEMDLADFAADVESLLGRGLENECFGMEGLGLSDCTKENDHSAAECNSLSSQRVKLEDQEEEGAMAAAAAAAYNFDMEIDMTREPFELNFDYDTPITGEEEEEEVKVVVGGGAMVMKRNSGGYEEEEDDEWMMKKNKRKEVILRLDYEAVITAWSSQGSSLPWTDGTRPDLDDCWSDFMGTCGTEVQYPYGDMSGMVGSGHSTMGDGGREARVSRYREKRRTRLFSKKIRYEVRKLNAEKRPRMKGRFVKRTSFAAPGFPLLGK